VATRGGGGATQSHSLSTCHPDGAPVLLEENASRERVPFIKKVTPRAPTKPNNLTARKPHYTMIISLL